MGVGPWAWEEIIFGIGSLIVDPDLEVIFEVAECGDEADTCITLSVLTFDVDAELIKGDMFALEGDGFLVAEAVMQAGFDQEFVEAGIGFVLRC